MSAQQPQFAVIILWVLIFVVFYIIMIRPQRAQKRKRDEMLGALKRGDRVVTVGGIHATVADIKDDVLSLDLAPNLRVKADRGAVSYVRSKGEE
ncbi:MAG: preprotein translocase subunit YajC [Armatimonadota bacterium]